MILLEHKDKWIHLLYEYNSEYNQIIKESAGNNNWRFDAEVKQWKVKAFVIRRVLKALESIGADISECIEYLDNNEIDETPDADDIVEVPNKINAKERGNKLSLTFPYNNELIQIIKSLDFYKWVPSRKAWEIYRDEAEKLYEKAKDILDCSELEKFSAGMEEIPTLKDYSSLEREPFLHQIEAAEFLLKRKKSILADEMGVGKTMAGIMAAFSIEAPRIIICPASLKLNWQKEIRAVDPDGTIKVVTGDFELADWVIISYSLLITYEEDIMDVYWRCVIFDEAHFIKAVDNHGNPSSKRGRIGLELARNTDYVFLLTGTPMTARPKDLFNLLSAIEHPIAKNSQCFFTYAQNYCGATYSRFGWDYKGSSNTEHLHGEVKDYMLRRLKTNLIDLPEKTRNFVPVDVNLKEYERAVKKYIMKKKGIKNTIGHLAHFNTMRHMLAKSKIDSTIELAENILENDEPVVIFTNFSIVVDEIINHFKNRAVKLTGDCTTLARQNAVDEFQSGKKDVFISNLVAGGVGITLTRANQAIVNDFDWTPANHAQGEDRIHRIGTTQRCTIQYVYANTAKIDERMADILIWKLANISTVIDGGNIEQENMIEAIIEVFSS